MIGVFVVSVLTGCGGSSGTASSDSAVVSDETSKGSSDVKFVTSPDSVNSVQDVLNAAASASDGNAADTSASSDPSVADTSASSDQSATEADIDSEEELKEMLLSGTEGIDIDLTALSSTMVYSEVYNMMAVPEDFIGKTIKMEGIFSSFHDDQTGKDYFACIIQDATACCAQGIEFELEGEHKYPDDYPEVGGDVCVVGVFDTYTEGEYTYCTLRNAKMM